VKAWAVVSADAVYSDHGNAERGAERARAAGEQLVQVVEIDARAFVAQPSQSIAQQLIIEREVWFNLAQSTALEAEEAHREVARLKQELEALKGRG
jgi:hypothetical protein